MSLLEIMLTFLSFSSVAHSNFSLYFSGVLGLLHTATNRQSPRLSDVTLFFGFCGTAFSHRQSNIQVNWR